MSDETQTARGNSASAGLASATLDAFAVLALPRRFDIDSAAVDRAYLNKCAAAHPDVSGLGDDESQRLQANLNDARATLLDAERRANVLLSLLGGPSKEQDKSLPAGFLMQIMETREEIEAALATRDPAARERWSVWAAAQREKYVRRVTPLFANALASPAGTPSSLAEIRRELNAWRYIERLVEQLDPSYDPSKADFHAGA